VWQRRVQRLGSVGRRQHRVLLISRSLDEGTALKGGFTTKEIGMSTEGCVLDVGDIR